MKKFLITATLLLTSLSASAIDSDMVKELLEAAKKEEKIDLTKKPQMYSQLYLNLSEEDKAELFETQKKFMDAGGLVPDMTAACSRWVTIGTVIRQEVTANFGLNEEVYFDVEEELLQQLQ